MSEQEIKPGQILQVEREYFAQHIEEWLQRAEGRFVLVKGANLIGFFNTIDEALTEGARHFGLDPFLIRRIERKQEDISIPALTLGILRANPAYTATRTK